MTDEIKFTDQEIEDYLIKNYEGFNLEHDKLKKYVKFIARIVNFNYCKSLRERFATPFDYFEHKYRETLDIFLSAGHSEDDSYKMAMNAVLYSDRKNFMAFIKLMRMLNIEKEFFIERFNLYKVGHEIIHARKCFFLDNDNYEDQNVRNLISIHDKEFEKKYSVNMNELLNKYPVTEEVLGIWYYIANLSDKNLFEVFKLTRDEIALIYPTTTNELSTLKSLGKISDEDILKTYGITRKELIKKHPLNSDTLKALKSINSTNDATVKKVFELPKSEVLTLRYISTDFILNANRNYLLKKGTYSKEELLEKLKQKKKGTNN